MIVKITAPRLPIPSVSVRRAIHEGPVTGAAFEAAFAQLEALHALEVREPPLPPASPTRARIAFWNAERLKYPAPTSTLLHSLDADAILLCCWLLPDPFHDCHYGCQLALASHRKGVRQLLHRQCLERDDVSGWGNMCRQLRPRRC